jgi:integrase/recombinase XerD
MKNQITFSQAIQGYLLHAQARHLSPHTIADYQNTFRKFQKFLNDDPPIRQISTHQIQQFLAQQTVSNKTILNYHTGLSALWTWAEKEHLVIENIVRLVERPKPQKRDIIPYTQNDLRALLANLEKTNLYQRPGKRPSAHSLPCADRNRAIILLLLDTGIRASELCQLTHHDLDIKNSHIKVFGKGAKERSIPISPRTAQAIWKYTTAHNPDPSPHDAIFQNQQNRPLNRDRLLKILGIIGRRAAVSNVHPHRFRHTFAVNFLRNGGDPWSLQRMLGHETMEMVSNYLRIAQADLDASHRRASPVDHWRL